MLFDLFKATHLYCGQYKGRWFVPCIAELVVHNADGQGAIEYRLTFSDGGAFSCHTAFVAPVRSRVRHMVYVMRTHWHRYLKG